MTAKAPVSHRPVPVPKPSCAARWPRGGGEGAPDAIRLCGMVGARGGWHEVPYVDCPADRGAWRRGSADLTLDGVPVAIMAGMAATHPLGGAEVMRGEETQIFGALALAPPLGEGRHLVALPGTHSKWASIKEGRITGFQTFLTGELFALLRDHSTLARLADNGAGEEDGFEAGLARAAEGACLGALFEARAAQLRQGRGRAWALAFLSGVLIGTEIAEAIALHAPDRVTLVGDPLLTARYLRAFAYRGIAVQEIDGAQAALAGLATLEDE